ncbi:hypothetical protein EVA_21917 [gut metagenome]|uniref:Uncharacterized protein n=1 Tax=gut metagenome TaxID=749906 RepID=J9F680_9ZZZZ
MNTHFLCVRHYYPKIYTHLCTVRTEGIPFTPPPLPPRGANTQ